MSPFLTERAFLIGPMPGISDAAIHDHWVREAWRPHIHEAYALLQTAGARPKDAVLISMDHLVLERGGEQLLTVVRKLFPVRPPIPDWY